MERSCLGDSVPTRIGIRSSDGFPSYMARPVRPQRNELSTLPVERPVPIRGHSVPVEHLRSTAACGMRRLPSK